MDRPKSRLIWLRIPNVVRLLRALTTGTIPLTHEGPHQEAPWRTVTHLRDLLMDSGVLPRVDRQILLYQRWLTEQLAINPAPDAPTAGLRVTAEKVSLGRSQTGDYRAVLGQVYAPEAARPGAAQAMPSAGCFTESMPGVRKV
ncbi:hypothetical protein ACIHCQ_35310 [Streptomyces sp. NPDC052236]|uniref:hypothetical protein n=1 Tax=Streptomyces sp. NPDC052236 TaxID=3365686 RepID=UPI0037D16C10